ncbi:hypothetical protein VE01_09904 [Pseudogymnoascus verrucosus]|uniref:J domain-containing protein n=1 Tax=Pseudogymnoascus verrucosus TaxID=342668 RepID=A0A1B8G7W6_9PEZI|nr:uncharacterized protein VE01_09904 [Pseudogymnoascus verrucosus]OBT91923.2 hypothetical protein VE01_09904 [Pseudogymnoascus verrucosus]
MPTPRTTALKNCPSPCALSDSQNQISPENLEKYLTPYISPPAHHHYEEKRKEGKGIMNFFTLFYAPAALASTANRCRHCNEVHSAPQTQGEQPFWQSYEDIFDTETFAVPVVRGFRYVQQPLQQPVYHTHHPVQQPLHHQPPLNHQPPPQQPPQQPIHPTMPSFSSHPHTALYTLLTLPPTAPASSIKTSYHRLALLTHPDKNPDPKAAERFKALSAAYAILSDPYRRAIYDLYGEVAAGRGEVVDDGEKEEEEEEEEDAAASEADDVGDAGEKDGDGDLPSGEGGRTTVDNPHHTPSQARALFEEPEQKSYEERFFEALRAVRQREAQEEARRVAGRRLYDRFWRGVRGRGVWNWPTRPVEPMDDIWRATDPMSGWRPAGAVGGPMEGYRGGLWGYGAGIVGGDEGLRERFRRSRTGAEGSPYWGWERGEGGGRVRSWSEGRGGGVERVVRGGYGGWYGRY